MSDWAETKAAEIMEKGDCTFRHIEAFIAIALREERDRAYQRGMLRAAEIAEKYVARCEDGHEIDIGEHIALALRRESEGK